MNKFRPKGNSAGTLSILMFSNNDQINSCTCSLFSLPDIIVLVPPLQVQRMCNNRGAICPPSVLSPATIVVTYHRARRQEWVTSTVTPDM